MNTQGYTKEIAHSEAQRYFFECREGIVELLESYTKTAPGIDHVSMALLCPEFAGRDDNQATIYVLERKKLDESLDKIFTFDPKSMPKCREELLKRVTSPGLKAVGKIVNVGTLGPEISVRCLVVAPNHYLYVEGFIAHFSATGDKQAAVLAYEFIGTNSNAENLATVSRVLGHFGTPKLSGLATMISMVAIAMDAGKHNPVTPSYLEDLDGFVRQHRQELLRELAAHDGCQKAALVHRFLEDFLGATETTLS